jgi:hypothetical protein
MQAGEIFPADGAPAIQQSAVKVGKNDLYRNGIHTWSRYRLHLKKKGFSKG